MAESKSIVYNGESFSSISALAKHLDIKRSTLSMAINKGMEVEEAVDSILNKPVSIEYKGVGYTSQQALADAYGIKLSTLTNRLLDGMSLEEALETPVKSYKKQIEFNGVVYESKTKLAEAFGLDLATLKNRLRIGWSLEEALKTKVGGKGRGKAIPMEFNGKTYPSLRSLALEYGVEPVNLRLRLEAGWSMERALELVDKDSTSKDGNEQSKDN